MPEIEARKLDLSIYDPDVFFEGFGQVLKANIVRRMTRKERIKRALDAEFILVDTTEEQG